MVFTELDYENSHYLIVDHDSILPSQNRIIVTDIRDTKTSVGVLDVTAYADTFSYSVTGRVTGAGRVHIHDNLLRIEYTNGLGFDISDIDVNSPYVDQLFDFLFDTVNKKVWYSSFLRMPCNCAIHTINKNIYSYPVNQWYNGHFTGIQIYKDGSLVDTIDSELVMVGLPIKASKFMSSDPYNEKIRKLASVTSCVLTCKSAGHHSVSYADDTMSCIRSLYGTPNFRFIGVKYDVGPISVDGNVFSTTHDEDSHYRVIDVNQVMTIYGKSDWFDQYASVKLDDITNLVNYINDSYDGTSILEYYNDKPTEVRFTNSVERVSGVDFDFTHVFEDYASKAYYDSETDKVIIKATPCNEITAMDNMSRLVGEVPAQINTTEYQGAFNVHSFRYGLGILNRKYIPLTGLATTPVMIRVKSYDHNAQKLCCQMVIRPAKYVCVEYNIQELRNAIGQLTTKLIADIPGAVTFKATQEVSTDPVLINDFNDIYKWLNGISGRELTVDEIFMYQEYIRSYESIYNFRPRKSGIPWGIVYNIHKGLIDGYSAFKEQGYSAYYQPCPTYTRDFDVNLTDGLFTIEDAPMDYNVITSMLPSDYQKLFKKLFENNTLCIMNGSGLIPFHLFFHINNESIPSEIVNILDPDTKDYRTFCDITGESIVEDINRECVINAASI